MPQPHSPTHQQRHHQRSQITSSQRRLFPRPLPLHLAHAMSFSPSWPAVLSSCMSVWSPWKANSTSSSAAANNKADVKTALAAGFDPNQLMQAWAEVTLNDSSTWLAGVAAYHAAPAPPLPAAVPVVAAYGAAQVLDYSGPDNAPLVVLVPSLINRAYILDLLPARSFVRDLAKTNQVWLLDWGTPGANEQHYSVDDYITKVLIPVLVSARNTGRKVILMGYCMGGLLALAAAALRPETVDKLILLAAPWDFSAYPLSARLGLMQWTNALLPWLGAGQMLNVDQIQMLFTLLQPMAVYDKFKKVSTGGCDELFVAVEDWLNDGVPLPPKVAHTCLHDWFQMNVTNNGTWRVDGQVITPAAIKCPTLVVVPEKDNVVPAGASTTLGVLVSNASTLPVPFGHIGMIVSERAKSIVLDKVTAWAVQN